MTPELHDRLINRLVDSGASDKPWALIVVAAMDGAEPHRLLGRRKESHQTRFPLRRHRRAIEPPGVYVASITVEGFRGVGRPRRHAAIPGPGCTGRRPQRLGQVQLRRRPGIAAHRPQLPLGEANQSVAAKGGATCISASACRSKSRPARRGAGDARRVADVDVETMSRSSETAVQRQGESSGRWRRSDGPRRWRPSAHSCPTTSWARSSKKDRRSSTTR